MEEVREDPADDEATRVDADTTPSTELARGVLAEPQRLTDWLKEQVQQSFGAKLGRYALLRVLGEGGMGVVFAAYDEELDRKVAIKLLRSPARGATWDRSWLLSEAKAMARISHPNIVQVYDIGEDERQLYVAMEFVIGVSLREWFKGQKRSWREVVEVCAQAGRGLQAAHEAGLVHCDFKPQNVLVGKDGRVRVLDFGLARLREKTRRPTDPSPGDSLRTTIHGGTPAYMAPEQYLQAEPDARTDQFAFCVALYEGLYGARPFAGKGYEELGKAICGGDVQAAPEGARVPAWLRKALLRGLSADPGQRWPSMEALLAALARDPARAARNWGLALGAAALVAVSATSFARQQELEAELAAHRCDALGAIGGAWDAARRAAVERAIAASELPFADDTWSRVAERLDGYAGQWSAMRVEACEANRSGAQSDLLYERRAICLEHRRTELDALVGVLEQADREVVTKAVKATGDLRPLAPCADAEGLLASVAPPTEAQAEEALRIRRELAAVRAETIAGRYKPAKEKLAGPLAASEALGYRPLRAEALLLAGLVEDGVGDYKAAAATLAEAVWAAEASRHDAAAAEAGVRTMFVVGYRLTQFDAARLWQRHVQAIFERRGGARESEPRWLSTQAVIASREGDLERAQALLEQAQSLAEKLSGADSFEAVSMVTNAGAIAGMRGDHRKAAEALQQALARLERLLGPDHPEVAITAGNVGSAMLALGDTEAALRFTQRARDVTERNFGAEHPELARIYNNLGSIESHRGGYAAAIPYFETALALRLKLLGAEHTDTANAAANLGDAYLNLEQPAKARELFDRALAGHAASVGDKHPRYAAALGMRGLAELQLGRTRPAIRDLEQALALLVKDPAPVRAHLGETRFGLARALWPNKRQRARALTLARAAIEDLAAAGAGLVELRAEADAWVRERE
jgi:tetratricopeptide (TPR) repeat protein/predicted Ser/Thr protein kinase